MRSFALICLTLGAAAMAAAQTAPAPWAYEGANGPMHWSRLDPAYQACSRGHQQSPIDIRHAHLNKGLQPIQFHYLAGPVTIRNTGNLIEVDVDPGSYIEAGGTRYNLKRLEFHNPSENAINGKLTDMDVEFIHASAEGNIAIVSVRLTLDRGDANATLATLWDHLPQKPNTSEKITTMVGIGGLLPADRGYWTFMGSLTTPPCTEGVRWFVMQQELSISRNQLQDMQRLFRYSSRRIQDLNGRTIEASE